MSSLDTDRTETETETETETRQSSADTTATDDEIDPTDLAAQVELLRDENRRLREEYVRARQSRYRNTALGLGAIGLVAVAAGLLLPDAREVLVALGATGLFGAVLTYYLTPSRFVAAEVGERVYTAGASNLAAIADELGLREQRVYVPRETAPARLYVPQRAAFELPDEDAGPIVVDEDGRGLLLEATGAELFAAFQRSLTGDLAATPPELAMQLTDALVEQFELVDSATADVEAGRATVAISGSAFGPVDRFDHPIGSFLATGFAAGLERPTTLTVTPGDDRADWLLTCRWDQDQDSSTEDGA
ncbi:hypothetical protein RBH26_19380 [Natronolimnohabitans sp. A-GB9]|uniref:hypothetical protein n=1 Tax=Natronolimnohabitans sp. A-GB9 TaxID=3069757 RepID=UPI0027B3B7C1|nr:hypothetical protein [Natronolimnohabitans sp. A-GB9]MDQ2052624.1 hypothetical protein [Natronolimnohabitans sp. A-GB9]